MPAAVDVEFIRAQRNVKLRFMLEEREKGGWNLGGKRKINSSVPELNNAPRLILSLILSSPVPALLAMDRGTRVERDCCGAGIASRHLKAPESFVDLEIIQEGSSLSDDSETHGIDTRIR